MPVRKITIKNLPKSEAYVLSFKDVKRYFGQKYHVNLFMTNDTYSLCSLYKKKNPVNRGTVVLTIETSETLINNDETSFYLHLYKIKETSLNPQLKKNFILDKVPEIILWIEQAKSLARSKKHRTLIVSIDQGNFHLNTIEY